MYMQFFYCRCGRPNLNHVTECYKCGATLAPTANKWIYVGSHSGRGKQNRQFFYK